jgi:hypothetical protein
MAQVLARTPGSPAMAPFPAVIKIRTARNAAAISPAPIQNAT